MCSAIATQASFAEAIAMAFIISSSVNASPHADRLETLPFCSHVPLVAMVSTQVQLASTQFLHDNKHEHHLDHRSRRTLLMNVFLEEMAPVATS